MGLAARWGKRDPVVSLDQAPVRLLAILSSTTPIHPLPFVSRDISESCSDSLVVGLIQPVFSITKWYGLPASRFPRDRSLVSDSITSCTREAARHDHLRYRHIALSRQQELAPANSNVFTVFSSSLLACRQRPRRLQRRQHRPPWLSHSSRRSTNCDPTPRCCRPEGEDRQCSS